MARHKDLGDATTCALHKMRFEVGREFLAAALSSGSLPTSHEEAQEMANAAVYVAQAYIDASGIEKIIREDSELEAAEQREQEQRQNEVMERIGMTVAAAATGAKGNA